MKETDKESYVLNSTANKNLMKSLYQCCYEPIFSGQYGALKGVLRSKGLLVACDTHVLIALSAEYDSAEEGEVIWKGMRLTGVNYPEWEQILPDLSEYESSGDWKLITKACKKLKRKKSDSSLWLDLNGVAFLPNTLLRALSVFMTIREEPEIFVKTKSDNHIYNRCAMISGNCTAVVCSCNLTKYNYHPSIVKPTEAIEIGELL